MFLLGLWSLSLFTFAAFTGCSDDDEDELVGNWKKVSDFEGVSRSDAATFTINNTAYLCTGYDGKVYLGDMWEFNQNANDKKGAWTQKASMESGRDYAVAFGTSNAGYVGLGYDGDNYLNDFWKYDPASNSWTQMADFGGSARRSATAFAIDGKGYVGTGYDGNYLKDFWCYNPGSDSWTQVTSIGGTKRRGASSFVIGTTAYVICGENNADPVNDFWAYNASTDTWTEKRKIANVTEEDYDDDYNIVRCFGVAFVMNGKAYVTCGEINGSMRRDTWEWDPITDLWEQRTSFEKTARTGAVAFAVDNRGFVTTGRSSTYRFDDMHEFFPTEEYDEYD